MIKPDSIRKLCETCDDSKWIGDVLRAFCGQKVELDFGQRQTLNVLMDDDARMEKSVGERRERYAKAKREQRAKKGNKVKKGMSTNVLETGEDNERTECASSNVQRTGDLSPSIPTIPTIPTIHTLSNESVCNAPARRDVPGLDEVVNVATSVMGVSGAFARRWHAEMTARDWTSTKGERIGNGNWRAVLMSWWNRATDEERRGAAQGEAEAEREALASKLLREAGL